MSLVIDGYNLLHVTGIVGSGIGPATLERARGALLNFLAAALDESERAATVVVFDGKDAPPGLPRVVSHQGLTVRYAPRDREADDVIEELIAADHAPRQLTVVSGDHRLQRAARRRKATAVDSHVWYGELVRRRAGGGPTPQPAKPAGPLSAGEVERWLAEFGDVSVEGLRRELTAAAEAAASEEQGESGEEGPEMQERAPGPTRKQRRRKSGSTDPEKPPMKNPFPPGYGEDLLRDLDDTPDPLNPFPPGYGEEDLPEIDGESN